MATCSFPGGAQFAFTIVDDTDDTTLENGRPIYDLLTEIGLRTTKTVWAFDSAPSDRGPYFAAETLQDPDYLSWVTGLAETGFEIAFHGASMGSTRREKTIAALDFIEQRFPGSPRLHCNHGQNRENLYWGSARYAIRLLSMTYRVLLERRGDGGFEGEIPGSPFFWGDVARRRLPNIRAFSFNRINCSDIPPGRPFYDHKKPFVNRWFNSSDVPDATVFKRVITPQAIEELCATRGWCIVSTHLGKGFCSGGTVDPTVASTLRHISSMPGWFVPASVLLEHLWQELGSHQLTWAERLRMECAHVADRVGGRLA